MPKKQYTVHVEDNHLCASYDILASTPTEAKLKAKEKFIIENYDIRKVKSCITNKENL